MARNLIVSYDLHQPGQRYDTVINAIKQLGAWAKVHYSMFYVKSDHDAQTAVKHVWASMDANDRLIVIDATNNIAAWENLPDEVARHIKDQWNR